MWTSPPDTAVLIKDPAHIIILMGMFSLHEGGMLVWHIVIVNITLYVNNKPVLYSLYH